MASQSPPLSDANGHISRKKTSSPTKSLLPPGWERVKSDQGAYYYWDKKSGKTSWKFPEEEAKAHHEMMKRHSYENIQLQALAEKQKRPAAAETATSSSKLDKPTKGYADDAQHTYVNTREHRTYVNVKTSASTLPADHTHNVELGVVIPPPPPPQKRDSDPSPLPHGQVTAPTPTSPTPNLPPRTNGREARSPTPPIPDRRYSDADIRMTPPPPLPQRQYSGGEDTLSPPPLPERKYSAADLGELKPAAGTVAQGQGQIQDGPHRGGLEARDRSKSLDWDHSSSSMKYEISELGHQYALVTKGKVAGGSNDRRDNDNAPPPLPKRFRERFNEDSPFPITGSTENISQAGSAGVGAGVRSSSSYYVDIDHSGDPTTSNKAPYTDTIAYAVVKVDGHSDSPPGDRRPIRRVKTPRPYEDAVSSGSGTPPPPSLTESTKPKRPPAYEEIDNDNSEQMDADGYMKVKRTSTGSVLHMKTKTSDAPGRDRFGQKKQSSLDQPPTFPPLPARPDATPAVATSSSSKVEPEYQTPDMKNKAPKSAEGGESIVKLLGGESSSQDSESVFESSTKYDLPSHRRLTAMNVTLRRNQDADVPAGYSKLDLSKEALLLRSGVTLRRLNHYSLSSVSSFMREDGTPEEEGSEIGSGTTPDTNTDEEDVLEPVSKCIKSMRNSLGLDDDQTDNEPYVPMARAPTGPPAWMNFKRRPHAYEDVQGGSQDETKSGLTSLCDSNYEVSKSMSDFDMAWDNSDMGMGLNGTSYSNVAGSSSQPDLLNEQPQAQGAKAGDNLLPHLVKPTRVSEEAFQLRKTRLMHHKYEDVEEAPGVGGAGGPVGDVNALTSAVRESWLEGGDKNSPPGSGKSKLPQGWRKLKDDNGRAYYWHVPTGRTQYERPSREEVTRLSLSVEECSPQSSNSPPPPTQQKLKSLTFSARYLGYQDVMESKLIPGQCVEVVHSCVKELTAALGNRPSNADQGKAVFLQVYNMELRWLNPSDSSAVSMAQPINRIRVWGIGLENERDFGYIARDNVTKKHKCHVFRCDVPARAVARALLESHQKERMAKAGGRRKESSPASVPLPERRKRDSTEGSSGRSASPEAEVQQGNPPSSSHRTRVSTSPMNYSAVHGSHEHYERIECTYIGSCELSHGMGMEILNEAVDKLSTTSHRWLSVNVDVATSSIKISDSITNRTLCEHRVRFLCFLGIARDDHFCGYILDGGERDGEKVYIFHGFRKEPNTDRLCLALHTACQARYKRVLEAHPELAAGGKDRRRSKESPDRGKAQSSSSSLFGRLGSLRKMKKPVDDDQCQGFVVQYCGYQPVSRPDGLELVKEAVQQLAVPKMTSSTAAPAHLVEFDVSRSGINLTDPQKKFFGRKHFSSKTITYVLRIRNYFAFVAKESGKFNCHVFLETEVDAGTIVTTIQRLLAPDTAKQQRK